MVASIERFVQQALITNNWNEAITRMENALLLHIQIRPELLELVPIEQIEASPLLQIAQCKELIRRCELLSARQGLSTAIKRIASQSLRKPLLSALSLLAIVNLRIGLIHDAKPIVRFLRDEWDTSDEEIGGDVAYALARGHYLLEDEADAADNYYRCAIHAFDRDGEVERGSLTLFELAVKGHMEMSPTDWEERVTEFAQRVRRHQADEALLRYLQALRLFADAKLEQAEQVLKDCGDLPLPHPFQSMTALLQLRIAIRTRNRVNVTQALAYMETLHPDSVVDLEWQFEWASVQFERAVSDSEWTLASTYLSQARAIYKLGLPPQFSEFLNQAVRILEGQKTIKPILHPVTEGSLWRAHLFGIFKFTWVGQTVQAIHWKRKKTKELALYLLLQQGYTATREQIAEALYPGQDPERMANQLYVAAHQLKSVIRDYLKVDGGVVIKDGFVSFKDGLIGEVDVEQYQALVRVGDQLWLQDRELAEQMYEKAVHLYEDIALDVQYVDWLELYRGRLLNKQCEILGRLGRLAVDSGRYERAEGWYRQWIHLSPLAEEAYQELLRVLKSQGKQSEAEYVYKQLELRLHKELEVHPLSETSRIIGR